MISEAFAIDQLGRIMGMVGFPKGRDSGSYIKEMRKAIQCARSEAIAEQTISDLLREFKRCPSVADIYEAVTAENHRGDSAPVFAEQHHRCGQCQDSGYHGGELPPHPDARPWRWCVCVAMRERREKEPNLVAEANANREKLIARFAGKTFRGPKRGTPPDDMTPLAEIYHGDF